MLCVHLLSFISKNYLFVWSHICVLKTFILSLSYHQKTRTTVHLKNPFLSCIINGHCSWYSLGVFWLVGLVGFFLVVITIKMVIIIVIVIIITIIRRMFCTCLVLSALEFPISCPKEKVILQLRTGWTPEGWKDCPRLFTGRSGKGRCILSESQSSDIQWWNSM